MGVTMRQLPLLVLPVLGALAPPVSFARGGDVAPTAAPFVQAASTRPRSLVLPACQRPHVMAHRGGKSLGRKESLTP